MIRILCDRITVECDTAREAGAMVRELNAKPFSPAAPPRLESVGGPQSTVSEQRRRKVIDYLKEHGPGVRNQILKKLGIPVGAMTPLFRDDRFIILDDSRLWLRDVPLLGENEENDGEDEEDEPDDEPDDTDIDEDNPVDAPVKSCEERNRFHAWENGKCTRCGKLEPANGKPPKKITNGKMDVEIVVALLKRDQPMKLDEIAKHLKYPQKELFDVLQGDRFERDMDGYWLAGPEGLR